MDEMRALRFFGDGEILATTFLAFASASTVFSCLERFGTFVVASVSTDGNAERWSLLVEDERACSSSRQLEVMLSMSFVI